MQFPSVACLAATTALKTSLIVPPPILSRVNNSTAPLDPFGYSPGYHTPESLVRTVAVDINAVWQKARCKGQKLFYATSLGRTDLRLPALISPVDSPWTQPFSQDLSTWGYSIDTDNGMPEWQQGKYDE
jgi:hypothetical protein